MFDGTLARATGKVSKLGAFMDSVFDRCGRGDRLRRDHRRAVPRPASPTAPLLAAGRDGLGLHGQLHPRQVRRPRLHGRAGHGRCRDHAARGPPRHPVLGLVLARLARDDVRSRSGAARALAAADLPSGSAPSTARPRHHRHRRHHHHHPADPPRPQPSRRQPTHQPDRSNGDEREQERNNGNGKNGSTPANTWAGAGRRGDGKIRVAIVGVGNCASSLVQGRYYYENANARRLHPGPDARRSRRLPRPRHRVRRRLRHRQEQGRQGPGRGDLHEAEQHVHVPAGRSRRA